MDCGSGEENWDCGSWWCWCECEDALVLSSKQSLWWNEGDGRRHVSAASPSRRLPTDLMESIAIEGICIRMGYCGAKRTTPETKNTYRQSDYEKDSKLQNLLLVCPCCLTIAGVATGFKLRRQTTNSNYRRRWRGGITIAWILLFHLRTSK